MQTKLDEAKAELLEQAARVAENSPVGGTGGPGGSSRKGEASAGADGSGNGGGGPDRETLLAYLQCYYLHTAPEDLVGRDPVDVFGAAQSHHRLAAHRPQGTANVRVHTPTVEENGWTCSHSVVEVVTDDMPFLVDSVTNELSRQGRGIHAVIHPQIAVRRDVTGKLIEVLPEGTPAEERPHDALTESWIHVEIDRETDRGDLKQITSDLLRGPVRRPRDRRGLGEDARLRAAHRRRAAPVSRPRDDLRDQEVDEARELLRWLAATTSPSSATASTADGRRGRPGRGARHRARRPALRPQAQRRTDDHPVSPVVQPTARGRPRQGP